MREPKRDKRKIVLSLLITAAFIMSAVSALATNVSVDSGIVEEDEAGDINAIPIPTTIPPITPERFDFGSVSSIASSGSSPIAMDDDGCKPVAVNNIMVGTIPLSPGPAIMQTGTYPLSIEVCRPEYCDFANWETLKDCTQETLDGTFPRYLQPLDVKTKCTADFVWIRFVNKGMNGPVNHERPMDMVKVRLKGDLGNRWYTSDPGDITGGTQVMWGAGAIPGSTVSRSGGYPATTNSVVTFKIPREESGTQYWAGCCDVIEWYYYVQCGYGGGTNENNAASEGGWQPDFCDCDMYDAEIKKFIEIYKWHDPITEDDITETIFCEDFEDPCEFMDKWYSVDHNADGDTWLLSTNRFVSGGHSAHNTQHATYMPNAYDDLVFDNGTGGLDVSGYNELKVCFQHWMQADYVAPNILDYGYVEYKLDGGPWTFAGGLYYANGWQEECFIIPAPGGNKLEIRFVFKADPGFCYEGWYIDDMCVYGTEYGSVTDGYYEFIMDSHSWPQWLNQSCEWYTFPEKWTVTEEGVYHVCAWLEALDPCHYSVDTYPGWDFSGDLCLDVEIGNILELELDCPATITPPSPATEGEDVAVETEVCNIGTLDATDVQVQMTVNRGTFAVIGSESFEGETPGQLVQLAPAGPGTYDDEWVRANPDGRCFVHYTDYAPTGIPDGSMAIAGFDASTPQPWRYNDGPAGGGSNWVRGPLLWTGTDVTKGISLTFDAKANFESGDSFRYGIMDFTTGWSWLGSVTTFFDWTTFEMDISGDFLSGAIAYGAPYFHPEDQYGFACRIAYDGDFDASNPACSWNDQWSGYIIDNFEITDLVAEPAIIYQESTNIPSIPHTTCANVDFLWPAAGVGQYVITTEILNADNDESNNICQQAYNVVNIICDPDTCGEITTTDLTGVGDGHWMVEGCCGGYFWCGDPVTTVYGNNWDDTLIIAPGGDPTFDCSGTIKKKIHIKFDTQYNMTPNDKAIVEVSVDDGVVWHNVWERTGDNPSYPDWDTEDIHIWGDAALICTATTQFRFRFVSNETEVQRGWFLDNIEIYHTSPTTMFGPDDCTTMDNFDQTEVSYGDWWQTPDQFQYTPGYGCFDADYLAHPWNGIYPNNINNALDWTLEIPKVFYAWIEGWILYDLEEGYDFGYVEISENDGPFTTVDSYSASANDDYGFGLTVDDIINPASPDYYTIYGYYGIYNIPPVDKVTVRWRMESDASNPNGYAGYCFEDYMFYGMEDTNAPVTTCDLVGDIDPVYLYYADGVAVYLTATDDVTGVKATYYTLDGGAPEVYDGPITAPEKGLYIMGNRIFTFENFAAMSDKSIHLFSGVQVSATVTIAGAPLKVVEFYLDDVLFAQDVTSPYEAFCTEGHSGAGTFKVKAIDVLDQTGEASVSVDNYIKIL